jgi:hypothetical protein
MSAAAWVGLPLVFYLLASGLGMVAQRVTRFALLPGLHAPVGACLAVLVALPVIQLGGTAPVTAVLLVVLAVVGLVLGRRALRASLLPGWAGIAALATLALYLAPVVLSGHWTFLGYNFVNDTGTHLAMVDQVGHHAATPPPHQLSTRDQYVTATLGSNYPLGTYGVLSALGALVPVDPAALYQPFIACFAALAAMALATLARGLGVRAPVAAGVGALALGAGLTYQYALHGAIKELGLVLVLAVIAALTREMLDARLHAGAVALLALCLAAGIGVFSVAAAAYGGGSALVVLAALAIERPRPRPATIGLAVAVAAVVLGLAVLPVAGDTLSFGEQASGAFASGGGAVSPTVLGHLLRPLPIYEALGIWFRDDYRYPLQPGAGEIAGSILFGVAGVLLVLAAVMELRRRRLGALLAVVPAILVYLLASPRLTPYADAKLLVVLSPMAVFAVAMGALYLRRRSAVVGLLAGVLIAGGVLFTDALAYHHAHLAPEDRLLAVRDAADHARGEGAVMLPEWEELAKYFAGDIPLTVAPESYPPLSVEPRRSEPVFNRSFDLDELRLGYVERWPVLMLRRSPVRSTPPANYVRTYQNAYYELWRRRATPRVLEHLPLQPFGQAAARPRCAQVRALGRRAGPGERLLAVARPSLPTLDPTHPPVRPQSWPDTPDRKLLVPVSRARAPGRVSAPAGRYRVWVRGGGGRAISADIDGRTLTAPQQINTPGGWVELGQVDLSAGSHAVTILWPGASLRPGDGFPGEIGRLVLEPERPLTRVTVSPAQAGKLCGLPWDWIERVAR